MYSIQSTKVSAHSEEIWWFLPSSIKIDDMNLLSLRKTVGVSMTTIILNRIFTSLKTYRTHVFQFSIKLTEMAVSMPIFIKDFTWNQSEDTILIKVPMKVLQTSKLDIITTDKYIKAHYPPLLFEVFLWDFIDVKESVCTVIDEEVQFSLRKFINKEWDKLECDITKKEKLELKKQIIDDIHAKEQENSKQRRNKNAELQRVAIRGQLSLDTNRREMIAKLKEDNKQAALNAIDFWGQSDHEKDVKITRETSIEDSSISNYQEAKFRKEVCKTSKISETAKPVKITKEFSEKVTIPINESTTFESSSKPAAQIPLPRKLQTFNVTFTPREFLTPKRESKSSEEEEWLAKQAEARRTVGFDCEDLRPEERNPQYLKEKGDSFFKIGNYLGAISAYSFGIKLSKDYVPLYVNRSAAHMALENYHKTLHDCSTALELMKPEVAANLEARARCIARRAAALCKLGLLKQGADEMKAAIKLMPQDEKLKEDLKHIETMLENENNDS